MIEIERSPGNVYADLGFPDSAEMLVKAQLVAKISEILASRKWTQQQASEVLGIPSRSSPRCYAVSFAASAKQKC